MTRFPEFFAALAKPFEKSEIKARPQGGRQLSYVTARQVMNRLDDVCGPDGWWDEYEAREHSVVCRLALRLPDGSTLTKVDAGGYAGMSDEGDDEKSGFSDSFKRAAVKFGVGRHLYGDGVPEFCKRKPAAPAPVAAPAPTAPASPPPTSNSKSDGKGRTYWQLVVDATNRRNDTHGESISPSDTSWMLAVLAEREGLISLPAEGRIPASLELLDRLNREQPAWVLGKLTAFFQRKLTPHKVSPLYYFERHEEQLPADIPFGVFLEFETERSGRGTVAGALDFLRGKLAETCPHFDKDFGEPEVRKGVLAALREYLIDRPCTLPPIEADPACASPRPPSAPRPRTSPT